MKFLGYILAFLLAPVIALADPQTAYLLDSNSEALQARRDILRGNRPFVSVYSIYEDNVGFSFARSLIEAAKEGRKPRLILDVIEMEKVGTSSWDFIAYLQKEGVEVKIHRPFKSLKVVTRGLAQLNQRMHVKIITTDSGEMITGSRNLDDSHFGLTRYENQQFDLDAVVYGDSARDARAYQEVLWDGPNTEYPYQRTLTPERINEFRDKISKAVTDLEDIGFLQEEKVDWKKKAQLVDDATFVYDKELMTTGKYKGSGESLINLLKEAKTEFVLESQYFVPDKELLDEMTAAVNRGVNVQVLANGWDAYFAHGDKLTRTAYELLLDQIVKTGADLREFQGPGKIHSKQVSIDGKKCNVWSHNVDPRSTYLNLEAGVQITSARFCQQVSDRIKARFQVANPAAKNWRKLRPGKCSTLFDRVITKTLWNNL